MIWPCHSGPQSRGGEPYIHGWVRVKWEAGLAWEHNTSETAYLVITPQKSRPYMSTTFPFLTLRFFPLQTA